MSTFSNGIRKTWRDESLSSNWDGEIELEGKIYYSECDYDLDYTVDEGDDLTPPCTTIHNIRLENEQIYAYNEETGEFDIEITEANDSELYNSLINKTEEEIVKYEYEWL